jgi:hypothetical protein
VARIYVRIAFGFRSNKVNSSLTKHTRGTRGHKNLELLKMSAKARVGINGMIVFAVVVGCGVAVRSESYAMPHDCAISTNVIWDVGLKRAISISRSVSLLSIAFAC